MLNTLRGSDSESKIDKNFFHTSNLLVEILYQVKPQVHLLYIFSGAELSIHFHLPLEHQIDIILLAHWIHLTFISLYILYTIS